MSGEMFDGLQKKLNDAMAKTLDTRSFVADLSLKSKSLAEVAALSPMQKNSVAIRISHEMALDYGLIEPTPEERAEREERSKRYEAERKIRDAAMDVARDKLADIEHPPIRAVLDLHGEEGETYPTCAECYDGGYMGDHEDWPCQTVRTIADTYGIEMP